MLIFKQKTFQLYGNVFCFLFGIMSGCPIVEVVIVRLGGQDENQMPTSLRDLSRSENDIKLNMEY